MSETICWSRVSELRHEVGEDDFSEVAQMFLEEVEATLQLLPDLPRMELEDAFHALKGCALNLGFDSFADLCARHEAAVIQGRDGPWDVGEMQRVFQLSRSTFLAGQPTAFGG